MKINYNMMKIHNFYKKKYKIYILIQINYKFKWRKFKNKNKKFYKKTFNIKNKQIL